MRALRVVLLAASAFIVSVARAADPGITDTSITLGMSAPFHGPNGAIGLEMKEAISAYFEQVNAAGGVQGRQLRLVALDDGYTPDRAAANTRQLIGDHQVFALVGYCGDESVASASQVYSQARVPMIGGVSGAEALRRPANRYTFAVRAGYADETTAIVRQMLTIGITRVAVLYQNDSFGKSGLEGVVHGLKQSGLAPVAAMAVERGSLDMAAAAEAIARAEPQAVVMVAPYKPAAEFMKLMRAAGQRPRYLAVSTVGVDQLISLMGEDARGIGLSQVMPYPWNDTVPVVREYQRLLPQADASAYSYSGLEGYVTAKLMVDALRRLGRDLTRDKLVQVLESMRNHDLGGFRVNYSPGDHNGSRFVDLTVIGQGGRVRR
ncbi:ABC transporter substrate-binding protein [Piscinibacter terrae]|uniref:ABC transporter permease n=1 Tax=Piscinibacter terrae TaxID=2496871 RepID=A0A3N7HNL2_9BURK|nr:ABC transporter substrate-binding protein [Albitalea terrae]RQP23700.1 ABC transporter permease [Albitalea terrae]